MHHGIFSEAITRFTKGQPAELTAPVLFDAVRLMDKWAGAKCISKVAEAYPNKPKHEILRISQSFINNTLGCNMSVDNMVSSLRNAEFNVDVEASNTIITKSPWWRADIHISEDIVEEIGRLNGFDNINSVLPKRDFVAIRPSDFDIFRKNIRKILVRAGSDEVLSYSFVHGDVLSKAGLAIDNSYKIINSISPRLQYYRQTLTPSLLDLIHTNIKQGYDNFAIFEINKTHKKSDGLTDEKVPVESNMLALTMTNKIKQTSAAYYQAKKLLNYLAESIGLKLIYKPIIDSDNPIFAPFENKRSAGVFDSNNTLIGVVGEYKKAVVKGFKLPEYTAGFEVDTEVLFESSKRAENKYKPISHFPSAERDICFQVDQNIQYSQILESAESDLRQIDLESEISPVDIYQADKSSTKNITIRIKLTSHEHTLSSDEVMVAVNNVIDAVILATKATVI